MQKNKKKAVVLWSEGFPYKQNASNEKNSLIAKALIMADYDVYLTSKIAYDKNDNDEGYVEKIYYRNFGKNFIRPRLIQYLIAILMEINFILSLKKRYKSVYLIASYTSISLYLFYSVICKISKVKLLLSIMEWHVSVHENLSFLTQINSYLFDKYAFQLSDGTIAISKLIINNLKHFSSKGKFLLVPALTDIDKIDKIKKKDEMNFNYILYCGSIGYLEVIQTIINAFKEMHLDIHLVLILHGNSDQLNNLHISVASTGLSNKIHLLSNLNYSTLIKYYKNASVLLVPLRDSIQDKARYPQKIAEYAACARPILSNQIGQVGLDFSHKNDIYFANAFTASDIAEGIIRINKDNILAAQISKNARVKAEQYFDYKNYCNTLDQFLMKL